VLHDFSCKFLTLSSSEKILKIGTDLTTLEANKREVLTFYGLQCIYR